MMHLGRSRSGLHLGKCKPDYLPFCLQPIPTYLFLQCRLHCSRTAIPSQGLWCSHDPDPPPPCPCCCVRSPPITPKAPKAPVTAVSTLSNGLRVVSTESGQAVSGFTLRVGSGTRDESSKQAGASLLLRNLAFQSTEQRSALKLNRDLEDAGALLSSAAGREDVTYCVEALPQAAELAVQALAETTLQPLLRPWNVADTLAKVNSVDLADHAKNTETLLCDAVHGAAFGDGSPMGHSLYSSCKLTADGLSEYMSSQYTAPNMVLSASGISHTSLVALAEEAFAAASSSKKVAAAGAGGYFGGEAHVSTDAASTHVVLAFQGLAATDKDLASFEVLKALLDIKVKSVASDSAAFGVNYSDTGLLGVRGCAANDDAEALTSALQGALKSTLKSPPTANELAAALSAASVGCHQALLCPKGASGALATSVALRGSPDLPSFEPSAITAASVQAVAKRVLSTPLSVAVVGDVSAVPRCATLAKGF
ncbi:unnamed protein product [Chrysoparadoxa australica]